MNRVSLFLAWRYLLGSKQERSISYMVIICFISILIGSFSLALVMSIMNGFEQETFQKLKNIHASINMNSYDEHLNWPAIKEVLHKEFPHISASTPTTSKHVIVQLPGSDDISNILLLRAIEPISQATVTTLEQMIEAKNGKKSKLQEAIHNNKILIGRSLAATLEAQLGEPVTILFSPEDGIKSRHISFDQAEVIIGGIFHTGIDEFDNHVIYCSFNLLEQLFPENGVTQIDLRIKPNIEEETVVAQLKERLGLNVYSWKQLYPALVSALKLEKYAMFFILSLIILVASMNIMSLLFMQIVQKRGNIAILKALGMPNQAIRTIFLSMGMIIALLATSIGLLGALFVCILFKRYPFIQLPDAYYVSHLPVSIELHSFVLIFLTIMFLSFLATWFATYKTTRITIASVLRFEA
ncbi:ABC transporter permease [Candidatus Dependentiae bacterium]|nr:MAG: ABC transporter permease [Candidatus Dependentiae bacterium]